MLKSPGVRTTTGPAPVTPVAALPFLRDQQLGHLPDTSYQWLAFSPLVGCTVINLPLAFPRPPFSNKKAFVLEHGVVVTTAERGQGTGHANSYYNYASQS